MEDEETEVIPTKTGTLGHLCRRRMEDGNVNLIATISSKIEFPATPVCECLLGRIAGDEMYLMLKRL